MTLDFRREDCRDIGGNWISTQYVPLTLSNLRCKLGRGYTPTGLLQFQGRFPHLGERRGARFHSRFRVLDGDSDCLILVNAGRADVQMNSANSAIHSSRVGSPSLNKILVEHRELGEELVVL